jgi:CRP-like cAMP-binding protein
MNNSFRQIMGEFEQINQYVARHIKLMDHEEEYFASLLHVRRVKKKQMIGQPGFTCKYRSYVYAGAMRAYLVDNEGQEHTIAIALEDWWISDYCSYIFQHPAILFLEAIEDSVLVQIEYSKEQLLLETVPKFERFFRIITQQGYAFLQKRLLSNLSKTAEERYEDFLRQHPQMAQRVPQYILASYLGMSTVYLSQLRNNRVAKKIIKLL